MTDATMDAITAILYPPDIINNAKRPRISWPQVGSNGQISDTKLADYQRNDLRDREWVAVAEWVRAYTDEVQFWYGPVIEIRGDWLALDVGFPLWIDLGRADVRRVTA